MEETTLPADTAYRHRQIGYAALYGLSGGLLAQLAAAVRDAQRGKLSKRRGWLYVPVSLFFLASMAAFSTLTVEVAGGALSASFTGGFLRRRIELDLIEAAEATSVKWHAGWGVRLTSDGWLYNVTGRRVVRLHLRDGRVFTVGTNEPELLLAAIDRARVRQD
jgi:hypothetical protein